MVAVTGVVTWNNPLIIQRVSVIWMLSMAGLVSGKYEFFFLLFP